MVETTGPESGDPPPEDDEASLDLALAPVLTHFRELGDPAGLARDFARSALRPAPRAQLRSADPVITAAALAEAFGFVDHRRAGEVSVRARDADVVLDGSHAVGTVVELACEDRRFIVSTVTLELHRLGYGVVRTLHPVLGRERGPDGAPVAIEPARTADHKESFLQAELPEKVGPGVQRALVAATDRWSSAARRGLADDLIDLRRLGAERAFGESPERAESDAAVRFLAARVERIAEVARLVAELESEPQPRLDAVTVATRAVRRAIG